MMSKKKSFPFFSHTISLISEKYTKVFTFQVCPNIFKFDRITSTRGGGGCSPFLRLCLKSSVKVWGTNNSKYRTISKLHFFASYLFTCSQLREHK